MSSSCREDWIQAFCLLLVTAETSWMHDGSLMRLAQQRWEESPLSEPADAVQRVLIERELERRRLTRRRRIVD